MNTVEVLVTLFACYVMQFMLHMCYFVALKSAVLLYEGVGVSKHSTGIAYVEVYTCLWM